MAARRDAPRRLTALRLGWASALVLAAACNKSAMAPRHAQLSDDVDAIERALAEQDRELASEGIVVAYRSAPAGGDAVGAGAGASEPATPAAPETPAEAGSPTEELEPSVAPTVTAPITDAAPTQQDVEAESPKRDRATARRESRSARTRCERVCGLAEVTCELRDRVCELAARHDGDVRYGHSCARAEDQCTAARSHCDGCAA